MNMVEVTARLVREQHGNKIGLALESADRKVDCVDCKFYVDQTTCESNGCTWHPDLNPAGNCMLDVCLTEVSGDYSVFKKEFGRSGCPCAIP